MKKKAYKMLESSCSKSFWGMLIQSSTRLSLQRERSQAAASQQQGTQYPVGASGDCPIHMTALYSM